MLRAPDPVQGRAIRAGVARRRAGAQQSAAHRLLRRRLRRHALSAGARGVERRQDFRRRALFQPDLRASVRAIAADHAASARCWRGSAATCSAPSRGCFSPPPAASSPWRFFTRRRGRRSLAYIGAGVAVYLIVGSFVEVFGRIFPAGLFKSKNAFFAREGAAPVGLGLGFRPCRTGRHLAWPRGDGLGRRKSGGDESGRSL